MYIALQKQYQNAIALYITLFVVYTVSFRLIDPLNRDYSKFIVLYLFLSKCQNAKSGKHHVTIPDMFTVDIYPRDYRRIRDFYNMKLKNYYRDYKVFRPYLNSLKDKDGKIKRFQWNDYQMESGKMFYLVTRLDQLEDGDKIWSDLFQLCLTDVLETADKKIGIHQDAASNDPNQPQTAITDYVDEQSIANFIVCTLSLCFYDVICGPY